MSEHKKTITAISWCPDNPDLFASASADNLLIVWNVAEKKAVARLDNTKGSWIIHVCFRTVCKASQPLPVFQASPCQSVGAGTRPTEWRSSPSAVRCTSGSTEVPILGSRCIKKPTPSCLTSVSSDGTPPRRANWCLDTQTGACRCFSQVPRFECDAWRSVILQQVSPEKRRNVSGFYLKLQ